MNNQENLLNTIQAGGGTSFWDKDQSIFILVLILILITINLVLLLVYYFEYKRNQKLLGISKKFADAERLYKRSQESANQLLNQTIEESQLIIERAYKEANNIIQQMRKTTEKIDSKTEAEMTKLVADGKVNLQKQIDSFSQEFKAGLTQLGQSQTDEVKKIQVQIYRETLTSLQEMIANLKNQSMAVQAEAGAQAQEELKKMQAEVIEYKNKELGKINNNLYDILIKSAKIVLGEGLDINVKKETVLKAIENAKRDGLIS